MAQLLLRIKSPVVNGYITPLYSTLLLAWRWVQLAYIFSISLSLSIYLHRVDSYKRYKQACIQISMAALPLHSILYSNLEISQNPGLIIFKQTGFYDLASFGSCFEVIIRCTSDYCCTLHSVYALIYVMQPVKANALSYW